ncbi:MAG: chemotaxis response regulator protein-glutamate methylesterase [Pseudomonadota bacterium]
MLSNPKRVLVVDDSALVRKLLSHLLNEHPELQVIDTAINAEDARAKIKLHDPDVVTLDIEMPGLDGLSFLEKIMTLRPTPVVMVSTLTQKGAQASLDALRMGAFDCVGKPKTDFSRDIKNYQTELHNKVLGAANANVAMLSSRARRNLETQGEYQQVTAQFSETSSVQRVIGIGASTGGTEAISQVLQQLPANSPGIVITQHIPEAFAEPFAKRLNGLCALQVKIAQHGERVLMGHAYVAPGDAHLRIERQGPHFVCAIEHGEPINLHIPSVDAMFDSLAEVARNRSIGVLLTGMGKDGAKGLKAMRDSGARTLIQDEASSVVWGMPGAAHKLDAAEFVLDLDLVSKKTIELCGGVVSG